MMLSACLISTSQPQPRIDGEPSWSQPHQAPAAVLAWQRTSVTTPPAAARIGVPRAAPGSTPSWVGRSGVRKPEMIGATTGAVQPEGAIWPGWAQPWLASVLPAARAPPPVSAVTPWGANGSCLAYA